MTKSIEEDETSMMKLESGTLDKFFFLSFVQIVYLGFCSHKWLVLALYDQLQMKEKHEARSHTFLKTRHIDLFVMEFSVTSVKIHQ